MGKEKHKHCDKSRKLVQTRNHIYIKTKGKKHCTSTLSGNLLRESTTVQSSYQNEDKRLSCLIFNYDPKHDVSIYVCCWKSVRYVFNKILY